MGFQLVLDGGGEKEGNFIVGGKTVLGVASEVEEKGGEFLGEGKTWGNPPAQTPPKGGSFFFPCFLCWGFLFGGEKAGGFF